MSFFECSEPTCSVTHGAIELIVRPQRKDLGEFSVARALPASERRMVGPFIFFDHMGPAAFGPGQMTALLPDLARSEGRMHFAGEHTSAWCGWMEGALESAERAAREILFVT